MEQKTNLKIFNDEIQKDTQQFDFEDDDEYI